MDEHYNLIKALIEAKTTIKAKYININNVVEISYIKKEDDKIPTCEVYLSDGRVVKVTEKVYESIRERLGDSLISYSSPLFSSKS